MVHELNWFHDSGKGDHGLAHAGKVARSCLSPNVELANKNKILPNAFLCRLNWSQIKHYWTKVPLCNSFKFYWEVFIFNLFDVQSKLSFLRDSEIHYGPEMYYAESPLVQFWSGDPSSIRFSGGVPWAPEHPGCVREYRGQQLTVCPRMPGHTWQCGSMEDLLLNMNRMRRTLFGVFVLFRI